MAAGSSVLHDVDIIPVLDRYCSGIIPEQQKIRFDQALRAVVSVKHPLDQREKRLPIEKYSKGWYRASGHPYIDQVNVVDSYRCGGSVGLFARQGSVRPYQTSHLMVHP